MIGLQESIRGLNDHIGALEGAIGASSFAIAGGIPNPGSAVNGGEISGGTFTTDGGVHSSLGSELRGMNEYIGSSGVLGVSGAGLMKHGSAESNSIRGTGAIGAAIGNKLEKVKDTVNERVQNILTLQSVLDDTFDNLLNNFGNIGDSANAADVENVKFVKDKINEALNNETQALQKLLQTTIKPSSESIRELVKKNATFAALADSLGVDYDTDEGSDRLAIAYTNLSNTGLAVEKVKHALKTLEMTVNDYSQLKNSKELEDKLTKILKNVNKPSVKSKLSKILDAIQILRNSQYNHSNVIECLKDNKKCLKTGHGEGESSEEFDINGGKENGELLGRVKKFKTKSALSRNIKTYEKTLKELFKSFMSQVNTNFKEIQKAVENVAEEFGGSITYDEKIKNFVNIFESLGQDMDKSEIFYALIAFDDSVGSRALKTRFLTNLDKLIESLNELKSYKYLNEIQKQLVAVKETIDTYTDTVTGFKNSEVKVKEGSEDKTGGDDFYWTNKILDQSVTLNVSKLINDTITKLKFYGNISQMKTSLHSTLNEFTSYKEDYDKLLGKSIGTKINELTREYNENVDRLHNTESNRGLILYNWNNGNPTEQIPKGLVETIYKLQYDAKVGLYKTIEAIDLYLMNFTELLSGNIEATKELNKMLQQTEVIAKWYNRNSGDKLFDLMEKVIYDNVGNADNSVNSVRTFITGKTIKEVLELCKESIDSVSMLKNILSMFIHIGDKFGNKTLSKEMYMSPNIMYKNLIKYIWVSAFTMGYGTGGGDKTTVLPASHKKDKNGYENETGDKSSHYNVHFTQLVDGRRQSKEILGDYSPDSGEKAYYDAVDTVTINNAALGVLDVAHAANGTLAAIATNSVTYAKAQYDNARVSTNTARDNYNYDINLPVLSKAFDNAVTVAIAAARDDTARAAAGGPVVHARSANIINLKNNYDSSAKNDSDKTVLYNGINALVVAPANTIVGNSIQAVKDAKVEYDTALAGIAGRTTDVITTAYDNAINVEKTTKQTYFDTVVLAASHAAAVAAAAAAPLNASIKTFLDAHKNYKNGTLGKSSGNVSDIFQNDDIYFVLVMKAITAKILTVIGTAHILRQPKSVVGLITNPVRSIIGGAKDPEIVDDAFELYVRLPLLVEFYKHVFEDGNNPYKRGKSAQDDVETIAYIPEIGSIWSGLIQCIFDESRYIKDGIYSLDNMRRIIAEVNNIYKNYKNVDKNKLVRTVVLDLVADVNKRYGVLKKQEIAEFYKLKKKYVKNSNNKTSTNHVNFDILDENNEFEDAGPSSKYTEQIFSKSINENVLTNDIKLVKDFHNKIHAELFSKKNDLKNLSKTSFTEKIRFFQNELKNNTDNKQKLNIIIKAIDDSSNINSHNDDASLLFHELVVAPIKNLQAVHTVVDTMFEKYLPLMNHSVANIDFKTEYTSTTNAIDATLYPNLQGLLITAVPAQVPFNKIKLTEFFFSYLSDLDNLASIKFISNNKFVIDYSKLQNTVETSIENIKYMISKFRSQLSETIIKKYETCLLNLEDKLLLKIINSDDNNEDAKYDLYNFDYLNSSIAMVLDSTKDGNLVNDLYNAIMYRGQDKSTTNQLSTKTMKIWHDVFAQYGGARNKIWVPLYNLGPAAGATSSDNFSHLDLLYDNLYNGAAPDDSSILYGFNSLVYEYLCTFYDESTKKIYNNLFNEFVNKSQSSVIFGRKGIPDISSISAILAAVLRVEAAGVAGPVYTAAVAAANAANATASTVLASVTGSTATSSAINNAATSAAVPTELSDVTNANNKVFVDNDYVLCETLGYMFKTIVNRTTNVQIPTKNHLLSSLSEVSPNFIEKYKVYLPVFIKLFETLIHKSLLCKKVLETTDSSLLKISGGNDISAGVDREIEGDMPGDKQRFTSKWRVGSLHADVHFNNTLNNIIDASRALINDAANVLAEINTKQQFFEIKENFIKNYYNNNNTLPLMPLSINTIMLNNDIKGLQKTLMPYPNKEDNEFKLLYGMNSVINNKALDNSINSYIWLKEELKNYNNSSLSVNKIDVAKVNDYIEMNNKLSISLASVVHYNQFLNETKTNGPAVNAGFQFNPTDGNCADVNTFYTDLSGANVALISAIDSVDNTSITNTKNKISNIIKNSNAQLDISRVKARFLNILDLNIVPLNIHALMREIPLTNIYNYAFTYDHIVKQLFGKNYDYSFIDAAPTDCDDLLLKLFLNPYYKNCEDNSLFLDTLTGTTSVNNKLGRSKYISDIIAHAIGADQNGITNSQYNYTDKTRIDSITQQSPYKENEFEGWAARLFANPSNAKKLHTKYFRNLIFLTNLQRLIHYKIKNEVEFINSKVVSDMAITNSQIVNYDDIDNTNLEETDFELLMSDD